MLRALIDTGPLVAFLHRRERHHRWAREVFDTVAAPLLTCEAVISEACFLLRALPGGAESVLELIEQGLIRVEFDVNAEAPAVHRLLRKYGNVAMSFADACLVRMSEKHDRARVVTLDSDFRIYRRHGRGVIPVLLP